MQISFDPFEWQSLSQRLLLTLIHFVWQATLALGLLALVLRLVSRSHARLRYAVSTVVLFLMPLVAGATFWFVSSQPIELPTGQPSRAPTLLTSRVDFEVNESPAQEPNVMAGSDAGDRLASTPSVLSSSGQPMFSEVANPKPLLVRSRLSGHAPWICVLYSLGVLWMMVRTAHGLVDSRRIRRHASELKSGPIAKQTAELARKMGLGRVPSIAISSDILVPVVVGVIRPTILLPCSLATGMTPTDLSAILSHELAHVRRYDVWVGVCQRVVESVFFFHPAVWWISHQVRRERENCCDDIAIENGSAKTRYVETLLLAAELCLPATKPNSAAKLLGVGFFGRGQSELTCRVERLLAIQESKRLALPRSLVLGCALALVGSLVCLGVMAQEPEDRSPDQDDRKVAMENASQNEVNDSVAETESHSAERGDSANTLPAINRHLLMDARTRKRAVLLEHYGGTAETEMAVEKGLQWILRQQQEDGSWSIDTTSLTAANRSPTDSAAVAGTAMALLALTGSGNTHQAGKHQEAITRGATFLLSQQQDGRFQGQTLYVHAISAYAITDLYALTGDPQLRPSVERAVEYSLNAQDPKHGGWRYQPRQGGDLSVTSWFVAGLTRAREAGIDVPTPSLDQAEKFVNETETRIGYAYLPGIQARPSMTGAGILSLQRLTGAWSDVVHADKIKLLVASANFEGAAKDFYGWLHITEALRNNGGQAWNQWNSLLRTELPRMQRTEGEDAGSWPHEASRFGKGAGPLYTTCFAVLTLQSYYREGMMPLAHEATDQDAAGSPPSRVTIFIDADKATVQSSPEIKAGFLQSIMKKLQEKGIESFRVRAGNEDDAKAPPDPRIDLLLFEERAEIRIHRSLPYKYVTAVMKALTDGGLKSVNMGISE